jgi:hypothetical protein
LKKTFSILLVILLLLNVLGYYGVFLGLQYKNAHDLALRLDADNYSNDEAVTIKVPVAIPYMETTDYERATGEFEYNGEFYSLVKQKFVQDTLVIVCVKNHERKQIKNALVNYVKTFTDKPASGHQAKTVPSLIKDFLPTNISIESSVTGWVLASPFKKEANTFASTDLPIISPPPRA